MSSGLRHGRTREGWQEKRQTRHLLTKADQEDAKFVTSRPDPTGNQATSTISGEQTVADRRENHGRPRTQETSSNNDGQNVANRRDPGRSGTTLFNQWRATRCGAGGSKSRGGGEGGRRNRERGHAHRRRARLSSRWTPEPRQTSSQRGGRPSSRLQRHPEVKVDSSTPLPPIKRCPTEERKQ